MRKAEPLREKTSEELVVMKIFYRWKSEQYKSQMEFFMKSSPQLILLSIASLMLGIYYPSLTIFDFPLKFFTFLPSVLIILYGIYLFFKSRKTLIHIELINLIEFELDRRNRNRRGMV